MFVRNRASKLFLVIQTKHCSRKLPVTPYCDGTALANTMHNAAQICLVAKMPESLVQLMAT